jgi:hypothetical protein
MLTVSRTLRNAMIAAAVWFSPGELREFLVSHEQLAKAVEPTVAHLDHPAPSLLGRVT